MNSSKESRNRRPARLLTALLWLALFAGSASVGQAQELSSLVITAQRPVHTDFSLSVRDEMHETSQTAVWMTRINVRTDLGLKLGRPSRKYQAAITDTNKRG
jgi:hypothetical protein